MTDEKTYSVGYKRPPEHTRFKPGHSGNPKGKAPGTLNLKHDLELELSERIPIREGERSFRVSKQRAMLKAMVAKALKGDTKAANIVLQLVAKMIIPAEEATAVDNAISDEELAIVDSYVARRLCAAAPPKNESADEVVE